MEKRIATAGVLMAIFLGFVAAWVANKAGASFAVQLLALMATTYVASWVLLLAGRKFLRRPVSGAAGIGEQPRS